jgi:glucan 1,3-beta-glucosidase
MAGGAAFQDEANPQPMFMVGEPGQTGTVELVDLMFSTKGAQPGAILVQWNLKGSSQGASGMWDCHMRVGGYQGSELQFAQCPKGQGAVPECTAAHMLLHLTPSSSAYLENVWAWTG